MDFTPFPKIARLMRNIVVTEKIDGTNGCIGIDADGTVLAGSRSGWITPEKDNFGFAAWVRDHADELRQLGPGRHFGEWWGAGIGRRYGLKDKRFSMFNTYRWCLHGDEPKQYPTEDPAVFKSQTRLPACVGLVPILSEGPFDMDLVTLHLGELAHWGSRAAPGFMDPEGIVVFHSASGSLFKRTIKNDDIAKGKATP